jgi:hypothetical protein
MTTETELIDPVGGEVYDLKNPDDVADGLRAAKDAIDRLMAFRRRLCEAAEALCDPSDAAKTRRVRGTRFRLKVETPPDAWDQTVLKGLWFDFPEYANSFLSVERLRVRLVEYRKIAHESGPERFQTFKAHLEAANRGPQGLPSVTVEEVE